MRQQRTAADAQVIVPARCRTLRLGRPRAAARHRNGPVWPRITGLGAIDNPVAAALGGRHRDIGTGGGTIRAGIAVAGRADRAVQIARVALVGTVHDPVATAGRGSLAPRAAARPRLGIPRFNLRKRQGAVIYRHIANRAIKGDDVAGAKPIGAGVAVSNAYWPYGIDNFAARGLLDGTG